MTEEKSTGSRIELTAEVSPLASGKRFDQVAAELFPDYSRARIQGWIKSGELLCNGRAAKVNAKLAGGESLSLSAHIEADMSFEAQNIPLNIVFEDDHILVINKPEGLVVHPAAGNWSGTLLNGLLYHHPQLAEVPRAGIVHRLDKDTSGLMVVAKTVEAQTHLVAQLQDKSVYREYYAIVHGHPPLSGRIEADIGRHPTVRTKMAVVIKSGKPAVTHFERLKGNDAVSLVKLRLETGRTHQIRVHMAHEGFPLVGDQTYGKPFARKSLRLDQRLEAARLFERQALHAKVLGLTHPYTGEEVRFESPLADDFYLLQQALFGDE